MNDWQPIETAPSGKEILLYFPAITNSEHTSNNRPQWIVTGYKTTGRRKASHWMPLPQPPKTE